MSTKNFFIKAIGPNITMYYGLQTDLHSSQWVCDANLAHRFETYDEAIVRLKLCTYPKIQDFVFVLKVVIVQEIVVDD